MEQKKLLSDEIIAKVTMSCHDTSMDNDPVIACYGRLKKEFLPAYLNWAGKESERDTETSVLLAAVTQQACDALAAILKTMREDGHDDYLDIVIQMIKGKYSAMSESD